MGALARRVGASGERWCVMASGAAIAVDTGGWASAKVAVQEHDGGQALVAVEAIEAGEPVLRLSRVFVAERGRYTIQIDEGRHQAGTGEADDFMNHSCAPNVRIDVEALEAVALRSIAAGELVTFHYLTTEWEMAEPFTCRCGAPGCLGTLRGFRHLGPAARRALAPLLSPFLRARLERGDGDER